MTNLIYDLLQNENEVEITIKDRKFIAFNEESEIFKSLIQECEENEAKICIFDDITVVGYKNSGYQGQCISYIEALNFAFKKTGKTFYKLSENLNHIRIENYFERGFINPLSGKFNKINEVLFYYKEIKEN